MFNDVLYFSLQLGAAFLTHSIAWKITIISLDQKFPFSSSAIHFLIQEIMTTSTPPLIFRLISPHTVKPFSNTLLEDSPMAVSSRILLVSERERESNSYWFFSATFWFLTLLAQIQFFFFAAEFAKLPLIPSYFKAKPEQFPFGVNFASGGAGALVETHAGKVYISILELNFNGGC